MKKTGFTIAEIVITLSIISVAAVLSMSAITNIVPDKYKVKVLNSYAKLGNAINSIFNNEEWYHPQTILGTACHGLECVTTPDAKLKELLGINGTSGPDNSTWTFTPLAAGGYTLTIDMDASKAGSTVFAANTNIKDVDSFIFNIDNSGAITPGDALTEAYLKNPLNINDKKADVNAAKTYLNKYSAKDDEQ